MGEQQSSRHGPLPKFEHFPMLEGQTALVTGAGSGIGKATAIAMARAGAAVAVNYRRKADEAEAIVEEIETAGSRAVAIQGDVSKEDDVRALIERTVEALGTLDILVNNAGLQRDAPIGEMSLEQWQMVLDVNLTGQFLCAREAIAEFRRRGIVPEVSVAAGKIICISSVHDLVPWAGRANYTASKAGVLMMTKSLASELARERIRVNAISPGAIRTPINKESWESEEAYEELMSLIPYNRIGEPDDVAQAAVWLASDLSDYITGTTLYVDGGMALYPSFSDGG